LSHLHSFKDSTSQFMIHFDGKIPLIRSQMLQTILFKNVEKQISTNKLTQLNDLKTLQILIT